MANYSRLDGVNQILMECGVRRVAALDTGGISEAGDAEYILNFASRRLQATGTTDNRTYGIPHTATDDGGGINGRIVLGASVIGIKSAGKSGHRDLAMRVNGANTQVYDNNNNTFALVIGEIIYLDLTYEVAFEACSPGMQDAILKNAAVTYQRMLTGNPLKDQLLTTERVRSEESIDLTGGKAQGRENPPAYPAPSQGRGG